MARTLPDLLKWTPVHTRRTTRYLGAAAIIVLALLGSLLVLDRLRIANRAALNVLLQYEQQLARAAELMRDMETGQRGFLLTGQETFLDPFRQAQGELPGLFSDLRREAPTIGSDAPTQITNLIEAATNWQTAATKTLDQRRQGSLTANSNQEVVATGKVLFDTFRSRQQTAEQYVKNRLDSINQSYDRIYPWSLVLLVLIAVLVVGAISYGQSLVQRLGQLAAFLQVRQDRTQAYNRVVTALNGPTELPSLLQAVLPTILETVGAQAGVIYLLEQGLLRPGLVLGCNPEILLPLRLGEGLPGLALQQNRLVAANDLAADTPYQINIGIGPAPARSVVSLPLRFGNQALGALTVASVGPIGEDEIHQLRLATSQLATAISNVRSFEDIAAQREELRHSNAEIARRLEENETLQEMGRELATQHDLQPLLQLICREARHLLQADYTAVATQVDHDGATKWVATDGTRNPQATTAVLPRGQGIAGRVIAKGSPVIQGPLNTPELRTEFSAHAEEGMQECFGVPLFRKEQPVGALIVAYRRPQEISSEMIDLATSLAAYGSVAIENARLLEELSDERDLVSARARELEEKNREVERATRLKSEFVANMSHELRTPLNSILALSQIMADELDGPLNAEQSKQIGIIERNGQNLLRLINDILDLSKIEAGKLELMPSSFVVDDLLENVRSMILPLISNKGLRLVFNTAPNLPRLLTDENKLKQVLLNLLSNAAKFTEHGAVTVNTSLGRKIGGAQGALHSPDWLTFEVSDTGIGIAPENLSTIWEEFEQIDGSLSRRYEGTGLGLTIVRRLVGLLGGEIVASSVLNEGSTFTFSIPVQLASSPQVISVEDVSLAQTPGMTKIERGHQSDKPIVLVVDDDPEVIYILEKYLRDDGYAIEVAYTGDEAISKARHLHPFAMTLDVMLPGRDGWDVIQALKGAPETADIPIIMLSMLDNRQLGYSLGASDYLVKPVSRNDLLQRLERLRNGHPLQTVLVVDDDPLQQRILSTTLRDTGMLVVTCPNGVEALAWLQEHTPDLITLDLMMPGMDGFTVLEEIKHRDALHMVPVLIITAKEITASDRRRLNNRIAAIIEKGPSEQADLLREVHERLQHHRAKLARAVEVPHE